MAEQQKKYLSEDEMGFGSAAQAPKYLSEEDMGFAEKPGGFAASAKQSVGSLIKGAGQAAADFVPGVGQDNAVKQYGQSVIDANPTAVKSLGDIADKPGMAVREAAGNATGSIGGMVGARVLGNAITAAAPLTGPLAPATAAVGQGVAWLGPWAAAALPSFGGIREQQIKDDPTQQDSVGSKALAAAGAGTVGLIENKFGPQEWALKALTKEGRAKLAEKFAANSVAGSIGKGVARGAAVEGAEELAQNPVEQLAAYQDPTTAENVQDTLFGGAMGFLGGGVFGGGVGAASRVMGGENSKAAPPADPADTEDAPTLALPAPPPSTGTPDAQVSQAEADRADQVAQAEANAAEIYRQRDAFDAARQANQAAAPLPFTTQPAEELAAQRKAAMGIDPSAGPLSAGAAIAVESQAAEEMRLGAASVLADGAARAQQAQAERAAWEAANPGIPFERVAVGQAESAPSAAPAPSGSFGAMSDLADLVSQERQDVAQRRAGIAERQGQRREFDLAEADRRTAESMRREAQARRRAVLDAVLADPETKNPTGRFAATLRREGYRDSTPTEDELRTIQRFEDVRAAKPAPPEVEPSAPNELDPAAVGIRERRAPAPPKNLREGMARAQAARAAEGGSMPKAAQPTTAPSFDPGKAWASLDTKQRADLAGRLQGVPQIVSKNVPRAEWEKINPALQGKLAEAMAPRAAAPIEGADLGDGWAAFRPESGTAGVPRAEMPQIKAEHRGAMVNFMNARGVRHQEETVPAASLKPTQAEFSPEKVRQAAGFKEGDRSILVSADNYILDGHHQWLAKREAGEPVKVIRLNAPIAELIPLAREFPSSTLDRGSENGAPADRQENAPVAPQGGAQWRADVAGGAGDLVQRPDGTAGAGVGAAAAGPVRSGPAPEPAGAAGGGRGAVGQAAPFRPKNLVQLVREAGGVSIDRKADINQDSRTVGVFRKGGMDLDGLAELLQQNGFMTDADVRGSTSGAERAAELLRAALAGERVLPMNDIDEAMGRDAEAQYREEIRRKASEYGIRTTFRPFGDVERDVLARDGELAPEDRSEFEYGGDVAYTLEPLDDIDLQDARTISEEDQMRMAGFSEDEINETINGTGFRESQGAPEQAQPGTAQESRDAGPEENPGQKGSSEGLSDSRGERVTAEVAGTLGRGDILRDESGAEYYVWSARFGGTGSIEVVPFKDGKPVVYAGSSIRFALTPAVKEANPERRSDPLFVVKRASPEPALNSYTNEDIARQEAAQRTAATEAERAQRDADQKAQADAERATFTLTGSDRPADELAARGQTGMFDQAQEPGAGYTAEEKRRARRDDYTQDLFGNAVPDIPGGAGVGQQSASAENRNLLAAASVPGAVFATVTGARQTGELKTAFPVVDTASKAAHAFAGLRKRTTEHFAVLVLNTKGEPIAYSEMFAGGTSATSVYPDAVAKFVYGTPGASSFWISHNHPSGTPTPSNADIQITKALSKAYGQGTGIEMAGHVIIAGGKASLISRDGAIEDQGFAIPAVPRRHGVPVMRRDILRLDTFGDSITSPAAARVTVRVLSGKESGVVFLNAQNAPVAFLPMNQATMVRLRDGKSARALFGAAAKSNASAAMIHLGAQHSRAELEAATQNLHDALSGAGDIRILDAFLDEGDRMFSLAESGGISGSRRGVFMSRTSLRGAAPSSTTAKPIARAASMEDRNTQDANPDEARRVQAAIEGKGLIEAARFMTQSADKAKAAVADAVLDKLQRLEAAGVNLALRIAHRGDMVPEALQNGRGYTETGFDEKGRDIVLWLNGADVAGKVGTDEETLLHELVHAATTGMVFYGQQNPGTPAGRHVRDLMAVTDAIAAHISQRFDDADAGRAVLTEFEQDMRADANNAFRSDDEVLAWALSSREAQTYLEGIPYRSGGSMWSRFVSAVRSLLGLAPQQDTALSEVLAVAERLMTGDAPMAGRAAFWHKRGMRMVQQQGRGSIVQSRQAGGDGAMPDFSTDIRRSAAAAAPASGITAESLPNIFAQRFPALAGAIKTMLDRGALGQKGGVVVLDTNDETQIAREFADRTGRTFDETVQMFESGVGPEINGFYDALSGTTFLVGPNLDGDTASAVVMHEMVHGQQRRSLDEKALAMIADRAKAPRALGQFLTRVAQRMEDVGESGNASEATAYIVEMAVQEGRKAGFSAADGPILAWIEKNIGKPVADLVREFVAMARAWALAHGVDLKRITVDDLVAYAKLGLKRAANGRVVTFGRESGNIAAMSERQGVAGKQAPTPAGDVEAGGVKPDFNAAAEQILAAIQNDDSYSDFGLRVIPGEFSGPVAIGDSIPNSFVWNNGDKTDEEIPGVSTAGIDSPTLQSVVRAIKNLGAHGKPGPNGYYFGDRIVLVRGERVSSGEDVGETIIADPEVVGIWRKPTQGNSEIIPNEPSASAGPDAPGISFSRAGIANRVRAAAAQVAQPSRKSSLGDLSAQQQSTVERIFGKPKTLRERAEAFAKDWQKNLVQGIFDQFAPIKDLTSKGYMLARLAKGGDSTLEAMLVYGKVSVDADGVYKVDFDGKNLNGFAKTMAKLDGEHDRFLAWVSGQRAERLSGVGLENLMTPADIAALQSLADGNTKSGKVRRALYADALKDLNAFNDSVLKIASDSGLVDEATREMYRDVPYVPFYRLSEEEVLQGPSVSKGMVNQSAWKQLKGGTDKLNEDLMGNLLKNWSHLITASANNRAAKEVLDTAARMGAATDMTNDVVAQDINGQPIYRGNTKGLVRYRGEIKRKIPKGQPYIENGQTLISDGTAEISYVGDRYFKVDDPHLMDAIGSIGFTTKVWKPMADFKRYLTFGVTVNPTFKIRNLIRDSIQAVGTAELSYNPVQNILMGAKGTAMMSNVRAQMLASGGMLRFGSAEGGYSGHVRRLIEKGVDPQYILDDDSKIKSFWKHKVLPAFEAYQELGDRSENVNRAALYEQLLTKGMSHAEASFWARDMMDFSMHGKWAAIRTLTAVVPFMNARLQGIYKLGRATKADYRRMGATLAAVSVASMALMLAYGDDDDWKKREDWDRDNSWWFKVGGVAFRIPKPFEVGAIGTIAERSLELLISDEMTGKRFGERMRDLLMHNLSMNPTPQLIKPMIDLYANKDGFSGRDIETQGMEKLRPEDRYTARTSEVARFLGQMGLPNPAQLLMGRVEGLSPVQIDHLIRGYFSWVGTSATTMLDYGIRPMMDRGDRPDMRLKDTFLAGNFVESLPSGSSRYVTQFYEQAKEIEQMYASYQQAIKEGDTAKAQEIRADNAEGFAARRRIESAKRAQSLISGQMRTIERSREMSGDEKRARLDQLEKQRDRLARQALLVTAAPGRD